MYSDVSDSAIGGNLQFGVDSLKENIRMYNRCSEYIVMKSHVAE